MSERPRTLDGAIDEALRDMTSGSPRCRVRDDVIHAIGDGTARHHTPRPTTVGGKPPWVRWAAVGMLAWWAPRGRWVMVGAIGGLGLVFALVLPRALDDTRRTSSPGSIGTIGTSPGPRVGVDTATAAAIAGASGRVAPGESMARRVESPTPAAPPNQQAHPATAAAGRLANANARRRPAATSPETQAPPEPSVRTEDPMDAGSSVRVALLPDLTPIADRPLAISPVVIQPVVTRDIEIVPIEGSRPPKGPGQWD